MGTENNCTVNELFKLKIGDLKTLLGSLDRMELKTYLFQEFWLSYEAKIVEFEICQSGLIKSFERTLLREAVGWRSYGQRNPLFEFTEEAYTLFENRNVAIRHLLIRDFLGSFIL